MPAGTEVRPQAWTDVIDLFDDGVYSAIWGHYRHPQQPRRLGVRWNESEAGGLGFPNTSGYPTWHVEPDYLAVAIIGALRHTLLISGYPGPVKEHLQNLDIALKELADR